MRTCPNEQLETEANRRAGDHLEGQAKRIEGENKAAGLPGNARRAAPPEEVIDQRQKAKHWLKRAAAAGYKVTVKVVADVIKEIVNPF